MQVPREGVLSHGVDYIDEEAVFQPLLQGVEEVGTLQS